MTSTTQICLTADTTEVKEGQHALTLTHISSAATNLLFYISFNMLSWSTGRKQ